jgi:hypothetical protein
MTVRPRLVALWSTAIAVMLAAVIVMPAAAASPARVFDAEKYALSLLNCTRTGGWVTKAGKCKGWGSGTYSGKRAKLPRSKGISKKVAFDWSSDLVVAKACGHALPGEPTFGARMSQAGYKNSYIGENVGCGWGGASPKMIILSTHRAMQAEKSYGGGHWKNMKNRGYKSVGVGVATRDGRTVVVYDFYGKKVW